MSNVKKVLVTGGSGFVGSETIKLLNENGIETVNFDLMSSMDIRDIDQLYAVMEDQCPDRVLHLAAIARFADADKDPKLAFETNVIGTKNVADVCKELHIPLVAASTGSAIMDLQGYEPPYKEEIPARGNSPYGCTKAIAEYYIKEHTPYIILRYSHLYGPSKVRHGLIGGFLERIKRGLEPTLYSGEQTNDFLSVWDVAKANYLALISKWDCWNSIYHIGSGHELSAKEAGEAICKVFGWKGKIDVKPRRGVDADRFCFDITNARTQLGFEPEYTFEQGLMKMKEELDEKK